MKLNKKKILIVSIMTFTCLSMNSAKAGLVKLINNAENKVRAEIIPEPSTERSVYCWKCLTGCHKHDNEQIKEIVVPLDAFRGQENFAVVGTEGGFLFNGECRNLSVFKNYEIVFFDTSGGIGCKSKEI